MYSSETNIDLFKLDIEIKILGKPHFHLVVVILIILHNVTIKQSLITSWLAPHVNNTVNSDVYNMLTCDPNYVHS